MKPAVALAVAAALASVSPAFATSHTEAARAAPSAAVQVAPLNYTVRTLPNGLTVYALRDTSTSNVAVQVWYGVGSKDDPAGRSGFAHLFEHLLFKSTRNMPDETFDRLTEDVGGFNNASTNDDFTDYFEVVPANHLQRILWAEADRMSTLVVDEAVFRSERDVVKEELRQRILASPYGRLFGLLTAQAAFDVHPYGRPGIGSIEDLDAATVEDVRAFHATYYRPDNATVVVSGNFDPAQMNRWIDQYFAPIARPSTPIPRVTAVEPERTAARQITAYAPNVPLPAVMMTFQAPAASSADTAALLVLDGVLTTGQNSRLHQALVYRGQLAQQVFGFPSPSQQPGAYAIGAILAGGRTADDGVRAVEAELARVRDTPVTAAELAEAKNELIAASLRERETADGRARALARAHVVYGDPRAADRLLQQIQAVTAADLQRVARRYLAPNRAVTVRYLNESQRPAGVTASMPPISPRIQAQQLQRPANLQVFTLAPEAERVQPPAPGAPVPVPAPAPQERRLANGLRVIVAEDHGVPLVSAALAVRAGGAADPQNRPGVAAMTATLLDQGTRTRTAPQIAAEVEALGATLDAGSGWDNTTVGLTATRPTLERGMALMADIALNPAFSAEELERQRTQALDDLQVTLSTPSGLARLISSRVVFGEGAYGHVRGGTPASLRAMTRDELATFHRQQFRPDQAVLVLSGDITAADGFALAERLFGGWRSTTEAITPPVRAGSTPARRVLVVNIPGTGQAQVLAVRPALNRSDPRYYPALLASNVLGGGYSARLNREIRIRRGLSYGANAAIDFRRETGPLTAAASTRNDAAAQVVQLVIAEMERLGTEAVPAAELNARRAALIGGYGRALETTDDTAGVFLNLAVYDVDLAEAGRYTSRVEAVTPEQVQAAAREFLAPGSASLIVVGDAQAFLPALRQTYPDLEVIEASALNLDSPTLR